MSLDGFIAPRDDSTEWMFAVGRTGPLGGETIPPAAEAPKLAEIHRGIAEGETDRVPVVVLVRAGETAPSRRRPHRAVDWSRKLPGRVENP